jgi:hypothetical protein
MKVAAWIVLVLFLGAPILIALWWVFPFSAGVCIWLLFRYGAAKRVGAFLKPILITLLLGFVLWLLFVPRRIAVARSYGSNSSAGLIRKIAPSAAPRSDELQRSEREQKLFLAALSRERLKVAEIASALDLYNSADAVFVSRNKKGVSDDSGLGTALLNLRSQLASHKLDDGSSTPDLLEPATLKNLVQQANIALDQAQTEALGPEIAVDEIIVKRNQLPKLVSRYQVDSVYGQVANVENVLRHALNVNLSPQSSYYFKYSRSSDTLLSEQRTLINLAGQQPVSIDLTALIGSGDPSFKEQISIREDASPERELGPIERQISLNTETKVLTVTRRVSQSRASYQLITDSVWIPFRGVPLRWAIPLDSSVLLNLRFPEHPSINWPLTVSIQTGSNDAIEAVLLPRHSFFYADAGLKLALASESNADEDELVPDQGTPKIADLATDKTIHVELLPPYLSVSVSQRYKEYLVIENLLVCLFVAAISAVCAAIVGP